MTVFQGSATFRPRGMFENFNADSPHPGVRIIEKAWGQTSGISADPSFASAPPQGDPVVLALQAKLLKTWGNHFPP
jgi:hypothetical protein